MYQEGYGNIVEGFPVCVVLPRNLSRRADSPLLSVADGTSLVWREDHNAVFLTRRRASAGAGSSGPQIVTLAEPEKGPFYVPQWVYLRRAMVACVLSNLSAGRFSSLEAGGKPGSSWGHWTQLEKTVPSG